MRTESVAVAVAAFALLSLSLLAGCPGTLSDKELYLAAINAAGAGTAGALGNAGNAGNLANAGNAGMTNSAGNVGVAGGAGMGPGCPDIVERVFEPSCGGTGCHGAIASQQDLDLVTEGVAARVVGVTGKACAVTLADPANPAGSLLYQKLSPTPPCGGQMPLARPPLSGEDAECVLAWIAALPPAP